MSCGISVLVLTKNEQQDLPGCLDSVRWSNDIHVFDSHSTDGTMQIAAAAGARVWQREFDDFASQRNAALKTCPFRHDWVLILDADERVPKALADEMHRFTRDAAPLTAAARIRRRDFFDGTWLKHSQISPFYIRLVRPSRASYEREINEVMRVNGDISELLAPFDHYPFSKGVSHWIAKHNQYSTMEARMVIATRSGQVPFSMRKAIFSPDFNERRFHQKELFYRLPARPLTKWLYMIIVRRAFLDGRAGITYAFLQSFYEYMIVLKTRELRRR
jgi:glycosyltransferase involved in cell wall biosynthesis